MKKTILILIALAYAGLQTAHAQERSAMWHFMLYNTGNFKFTETGGTPQTYSSGMAYPTIEAHITDEDFYIDFSGLAFLVPAVIFPSEKTYVAPALDFGWGWHLFNKKGLVSFGLGFNLGVFTVQTKPVQNSINATPFYIGPTLSANVQVGKKINIQNTLKLNYSGEKNKKKYSGSGMGFHSIISYKLNDTFGVTLMPVLNSFSYKKENNDVDKFKYSTSSVQFGANIKF